MTVLEVRFPIAWFLFGIGATASFVCAGEVTSARRRRNQRLLEPLACGNDAHASLRKDGRRGRCAGPGEHRRHSRLPLRRGGGRVHPHVHRRPARPMDTLAICYQRKPMDAEERQNLQRSMEEISMTLAYPHPRYSGV